MWESAKSDDDWCVLEMPLVRTQNRLVGSHQVCVLFSVGRWDVAEEQHRLVHISHSTSMGAAQACQSAPLWQPHCHSSRVFAVGFS